MDKVFRKWGGNYAVWRTGHAYATCQRDYVYHDKKCASRCFFLYERLNKHSLLRYYEASAYVAFRIASHKSNLLRVPVIPFLSSSAPITHT